ncbi:MAG: hypothetical protein C4576_17740 [Desulfobacteraceae bacterium]|nr:MAG: hypothetical protein C4576_17740 [Desulfobacteraceae bacterium]
MLQERSDLLTADKVPDELLALLRQLSCYPFALFVEELKDAYSFSHQSLREFVLAWCVAKEIRSRSFDLLKSSSSFDYEGHEFYDRLRVLLEVKKDVIDHLPHILDLHGLTEGERNHLIRNLFEMLGELSPNDEDHVQRVVNSALPYLKQRSGKGKAGYITFKTRYNILRCLERIHWSAPTPYIDHIKNFSWWKDSNCRPPRNEYYLYAYTVRGFHRPKQEATAIPPIVYRKAKRSAWMKALEETVSNNLISVIEEIKGHEIPEDGCFLGINCTLALIRWLPKNPDLDRIASLMQVRHMDWRMKQNLFYALLMRYGRQIPERFRKQGLFRDAGELHENTPDEAKEIFRYLRT